MFRAHRVNTISGSCHCVGGRVVCRSEVHSICLSWWWAHVLETCRELKI